jgi:putative protein kinase ArgK-like GTPase of G3E family
VESHKQHLEKHGLWQEKEKARLLIEVKHILMDRLFNHWKERVSELRLQQVIQEVLSHSKSPSVAVDELIGNDDLVT